MSTIQVKATLSTEELVNAAQQLDNQTLKNFSQQIASVYAQRAAQNLPEREGQLLEKINRGIPESVWRQFQELTHRRQQNNLTPEEQKTLILLTDQIEEINAERIGYLAELAQLRSQTLPELMDALNIRPLNHG